MTNFYYLEKPVIRRVYSQYMKTISTVLGKILFPVYLFHRY